MKTRIVRTGLVWVVVLAMLLPLPAAAGAREPAALPAAAPYTETVLASAYEPETLDPALAYSSFSGDLLRQVYEPLLLFNREKTDEFVPMLATSWTLSPDGKTYTFQIRKGVKFHNGAVLSPTDVAFTFQRGLLQGGTASPQWLFTEPLLGVGIDDISLLVDPLGNLYNDQAGIKAAPAAKLKAACQTVKNAITADEAQGTVTFHLKNAWGPFLPTLAGYWGGIVNQGWIAANGGWNGDCTTWQNYYASEGSTHPFNRIANGTGPYRLDHWYAGQELGLVRNLQYWRNEPVWPGGPKGLAAIEKVTYKFGSSDADRLAMLQQGLVDFADVSQTNFGELDALSLLDYPETDGIISRPMQEDGVLKRYTGGLEPSATDVFFNFHIESGGPINYLGSGTLDGNGIPPSFFSDIHVRKAFNYAFDWDRYMQDVFGGQAVQRHGPIIKGTLGYSDATPIYSHNPALAMQEFNQAWGGMVALKGFSMTLTYHADHLIRQKVVENLKSNLEALSPKFHVTIVEVDWETYRNDQHAYRLPVFINGWNQDIPHPHNWVLPYLAGSYAKRQAMPDDMLARYQAKIDECLRLTETAAVQTCYEQIGQMTYDDAPGIYLAQARNWSYARAEVRGYYVNTDPGVAHYFYAYSKGPRPVLDRLTPESGGSVSAESRQGATISLAVPTGAVNQNVSLLTTTDVSTSGRPAGFALGNLAFEIKAFAGENAVEHLNFLQPVAITLHYDPARLGPLVGGSLKLFTWNGSAWEDAACGETVLDEAAQTLQVPVCHLSQFALGGSAFWNFLPFSARPQ